MDRRQIKTRKAVYDAFTNLLKSKPYSDITIQDIIDEANIGRSTFYAHFETKDDLLNVLCKEIFDHVFSEHLSVESGHDFSKEHGLGPELTHILYHLDDNRAYIAAILSSDGGEVFMRYFKEYLGEMFDKEATNCPEGIPRDYFLDHMVSGFSETVRWWMSSDLSPEEMVRCYCALHLGGDCGKHR